MAYTVTVVAVALLLTIPTRQPVAGLMGPLLFTYAERVTARPSPTFVASWATPAPGARLREWDELKEG
jgi:hypothetical protein